ncbi:DUF3575 domain-containing protein [Alistipes finegoldii]|uniref:DUF3575 domain-containing protein n=1 Tax=Alistipes finegoldii TaxID=214856 RepID=UPI002674AC87|nr:DUF3575 domain-containing protein [Alistipes finegoldii]
MRIERILFLFLLSACFYTGYGQETPRTDTLGVDVYYRRGFSVLEDSLRDNGVRLTSFADRLRALQQDTSRCIRQVRIVSGTSPEGTAKANRRLAYNRSERIRQYLNRHFPSWNLSFDIRSEAEDWSGLAALVAASDMPARDEVLDILHNTPVWVFENGRIVDGRKRQLGMLQGGRPWRYMEERFFPELRRSKVRVVYENIATPAPEPAPAVPEPAQETARPKDPVAEPAPAAVGKPAAADRKPFYMALKTNLLYDAALIPNLGAEFYVGRGWSVGGSWMYAWWNSDRKHNYWRTYGGELDIRKYFGRRAGEKPLTGHHLGLYGQMLTYDFELGGKGYMGGRPGGTLWDKMHWGVGLEYGYSLPVGRRLNLDFGIGVGYLGGEYWEYTPQDDHYLWLRTKKRHWFGPTKAEVSLVWLIGRGNSNEKKGGKR